MSLSLGCLPRVGNKPRRDRPRVAALGGDGIGPEVVGASVRCLEALNSVDIVRPIHGAEAVAAGDPPLPDAAKEAILDADAVLFGAVDTERGHAVSALRFLRFQCQSFANVRPAMALPGIRKRIGDEQTNLVAVRELTEGEYPAREGDLREWREALAESRDVLGRPLPEEGWFAMRVVTPTAVKRIARYAAELALVRKSEGLRGHITIVTKRNVLRRSDAMFEDLSREVIREVSPDIEIGTALIDDACRRLVADPNVFDVVLLPNLYGDIFSDIASEIIGGIPFAPSASIGETTMYFEACHGSAPDIAGRGLANPAATMLSAAMMLETLGLTEDGQRLLSAVISTVRAGKCTPDLGGDLTTDQFTQAVIENLSRPT